MNDELIIAPSKAPPPPQLLLLHELDTVAGLSGTGWHSLANLFVLLGKTSNLARLYVPQ